MVKKVFVGSKQQSHVMVAIEASGMTPIDVRRQAIQLGRSLHHIMDPIALSDHEAAVRMRRQFEEQYRRMPNLNNGVPFHRLPENKYGR